MRRSSPSSPAKLAARSVLGGLIGASAFFIVISPLERSTPRPSHLGWAFILEACLAISGFSMAYLSASDLESGIANDRWPEDEINSVRARLQSPLSTALIFALFAAFVGLAFFTQHFRFLWWPIFMLLTTLNFLRSSVRLRSAVSHKPKWSQLSPLRSDHWGQH